MPNYRWTIVTSTPLDLCIYFSILGMLEATWKFYSGVNLGDMSR